LAVVFGSSPSDIWGSEYTGRLFHFDGMSWTEVNFPGGRAALAGFARAPNDAILVAYDGQHTRPWHWDGSSWWPITLPIFQSDFIGEFWGTAPDDVWAVGGNQLALAGAIYHWDGDSWQRAYSISRGYVTHVGGTARDDAWFTVDIGNQRTTVLHWDGSSFTELDTIDGHSQGITSTGPSDVWLILGAEIRHYDGVSWNSERHPWVSKLLGFRDAGLFVTSYSGHIYQTR
jgi:hypothetical protein